MKNKLHILILPSWYVSKSDKLLGVFFKEQAEALAKYNKKIGVISSHGVDIRTILSGKKFDFSKEVYVENNVNTYISKYLMVPKLHQLRRSIQSKLFYRLFEKYIGEQGLPDIVHLHSFKNGNLAMWIKEKYNIPYVVTEHTTEFARNDFSNKNLLFAKKVFENSAYNIAVSNEFVKLLNSKLDQEFHYIPNMINIDYFDLKKKKYDDFGDFDFINIAFLDEKKNQKMLIKSFTKSFKNKSVKLTIVGNGPLYNSLNELIEALDMRRQIKLYGKASRSEVKDLLQNSDAFVTSSKYETFGVVLIEAMSCGLPVVSTRSGGPESIITSDKLGLLTDINEEDLSIKMEKLYENIKEFDAVFIRQYINDNFSEKFVTDKLIKVYKQVLT